MGMKERAEEWPAYFVQLYRYYRSTCVPSVVGERGWDTGCGSRGFNSVNLGGEAVKWRDSEKA